MDASPQDSQALKPSLRKLGSAMVGLLQGHLELIGVEFQEEKDRSLRLLMLAGISLVLALLILVGLSAAIVIAFWDSHPIIAILVLCLLYGAGLAFCLTRAFRLVKESAMPFQATLEELARNRERLLP